MAKLAYGRKAIMGDAALVGGLNLGPYMLSREFLLFDSFHLNCYGKC